MPSFVFILFKEKKKGKKRSNFTQSNLLKEGKYAPHTPQSAKFLKNSSKRNVFQISEYDCYC